MWICITHDAGVGQYAKGAVINLDDRRAGRLIHDGYAAQAAEPEKVKKRKD